jgi:hypothetical protein
LINILLLTKESENLKRIILLSIIGFTGFFTQAQENLLSHETPAISVGAEFNLLLQQKIKNGEDADLKVANSPMTFQKFESTALITTFEGINFNQNASLTGYYQIPPDPIGAAGPNHLVSVVNSSIEWFTKAGVKQNSQRLGRHQNGSLTGSFFETLGPVSGTFDPKVIYDQYNNRFIVITLEHQASPQVSRILVAVSQTSNPNDGWHFHLINSLINIGGNSWADYPGLAVGTDAIYITANMFRFSGSGYAGGRLWIIAKSPFYSGGTASVNVYDHITLATGNKYSSTYQPAHMFGTPPTNVGIFLILYSGLSDGTNESVNVIRVDNPLTSPSFTGQNISQGNVDNTSVGSYNNAPQLGTTSRIATNDRRSLNAVWRNNSLWSVFCIVPPSGVDAGQVTAHWVRINTTTLSSLTLSDQGNIGGESIATGCYTFFPSISINSSNDACIGFSASASTIYPGAYYTGRISSDPPGYTINPDSVMLGRDYYIRTFGSGSNRWGDYSGSCVDPSDDQTFYVFNQYAITRGTPSSGEDGRWGTAFGVVPVSALPVELSSFTAKVLKSGGVQLNWRTETEVNNYGFEVERLQDYKIERLQDWEKIGFVEGNGNSNSPKDYSLTDNSSGYGKYAYRLMQIDTDGQFEYSKIIEVDAGNIPSEIVLEQNYPNPFNPSTTIKFALAETQTAKLTVYDILGNEVAVLFNEIAEGGKVYELEFNSHSGESQSFRLVRNLTSGVYFYQLATDNRVENRKMLLLK